MGIQRDKEAQKYLEKRWIGQKTMAAADWVKRNARGFPVYGIIKLTDGRKAYRRNNKPRAVVIAVRRVAEIGKHQRYRREHSDGRDDHRRP